MYERHHHSGNRHSDGSLLLCSDTDNADVFVGSTSLVPM